MVSNPRLLPFAIASTTGELADANQIVVADTSLTGVVQGSAHTQTALERLDATGIGSAITIFSGTFAATSANLSTWFNGRQQNRLRWTDDGSVLPLTFTLPDTAALNAAFDQLVTAGVPEVIRLIVEYTGPTVSFLTIQPAGSADPQILNTASVVVRSGVQAQLEITRTGSTISDFIFQSIGGIGDNSGGTLDAIKLINPSERSWDASANGPLPNVAVVKGNAYRVINAPSDGSGRFGEVMQNGDWVVWEGETFTSWSATTLQWFVIPAHEVRRITALEEDFLTFLQTSAPSDRNTVTRGALLADTVGEIRIKLYPTRGDYSAADLNTTGDIDEFTDPATQTAFVGIRLPGTLSTNQANLPNLYLYAETSGGEFIRLLNLQDDFTHEGDFGAESDYLSLTPIDYAANDTLRIYFGTFVERYVNPNLDVTESNLTDDVQAKLNRTDPNGTLDEQRLATLESQVATLLPLAPDVTDLTEFADAFNPARTIQQVDITQGYSLLADYRGDGTRYESTGVTYDATGTNVVRYSGLSQDLRRVFAFKVDGPADQVLMWIVDGAELIPFVDITAAGAIRINDYTPATTQDETVSGRLVFLTRTSGATVLTRASNSVSTYTIARFPTNATQTSRVLQIDPDIYINGTNTLAGRFLEINLPADNTAQPRRTVSTSVYLGPLYGNRTVNVTLGYELRVSGDDLLIDFTLVSAPSDVTVEVKDVYTALSYTAPTTVARVDNFVTFEDGAPFTFSGAYEFALCFHPIQNTSIQNAVLVGIDTNGTVTQFNDKNVPDPDNLFESVEVPDAAAVSGYEFRTFLPDHFFIHRDLANLITRRGTQWVYGLALLRSVTDFEITERFDFPQDIVLVSPDASRWRISISDAGTLQTTKLP